MSSQETTPTGADAPGDHISSSTELRDGHRALADRIIAIANPKTTLDVGCAGGLLVQALAEKGVDSHGIDISEAAVAGADPDVRPRLEAGSAARPLRGTYDLVSCIDVLEHMSPADAQATIDAMCAVTERIVFSSDPGGFDRPTLVNGHPAPDWAAAFAERGFYRRTDVNLDFLTPWAVLLERSALQPRDIVHRYESYVVPMSLELRHKREALLASSRDVADLRARLADRVDPSTADRIARLESELEAARHEVLTTRDHIIGLEAEAVRLQGVADRLESRARTQQKRIQKMRTRLTNLRRRAERAERKVDAVKGSRAWRVGTKLTGASRAPKL